MRLVTFATGMAAGYVLGTRAGREKYEQIVEGARQLRGNPTAAQAQETVKTLLSGPAPAEQATATPTPTTASAGDKSGSTPKPTRRRNTAAPTPATLAEQIA